MIKTKNLLTVDLMITLNYIGYYRCSRDYKDEQPRQGIFSDVSGYIELIKGENYEQGLKNLDGFDHIWIIFVFHHNSTWKPLVNPPYSDGAGKKGVFATRSPYRPNPIGMSCVRLEKIIGNRLYIRDSDLLNNTPVLDIKPYINDYDSVPDASRGWLDKVVRDDYLVVYTDEAKTHIDFLKRIGTDLTGVIQSRLSYNPLDTTRNKFDLCPEGYLLKFKSWEIRFIINNKTITILNVRSAYTNYTDICGNDSIEDIEVHRKFNIELETWNKNG